MRRSSPVGIEMVHDHVDLEGDLGLQLGEVDVVPVQRQSVAGGLLQAVASVSTNGPEWG